MKNQPLQPAKESDNRGFSHMQQMTWLIHPATSTQLLNAVLVLFPQVPGF
jgi:hypothetical protein